jgi:transposase
MARYKPYDFTQMMMVPVSLDQQLVPGTLEHTIHFMVEERLDLSGFDQEYKNDETGCKAYSPKVLLKVVLLGYSRGKKGSRKLEAACRENIVFMALACGQRPDHSTFASFISGMGEERIRSLFTQVLMVCEEEGLLGGTHFSLDGCKLSSNASKEWSGTRADLLKKKEKLEGLVKSAMEEHKRNDRKGIDGDEESRRIKRLAHKAERIERFLKENGPKIGRIGKEIQSNVTDNESAKMATSHGVVQGYNAEAMVDSKHQIVVNAEAFGEGGDSGAARSMLAGAQANLEVAGCGKAVLEGAVLSADTGFFSEENWNACEEFKVDAYIPDPKFRKRDPRLKDAGRFRRPTDKHKKQYQSKRKTYSPKDFVRDPATGRLICPAGKLLCTSGSNNRYGEYIGEAFRAPESACRDCHLRAKCLRNPNQKGGRQVRYLRREDSGKWTTRMMSKIDTVEGRRIYSMRMGNVEPVFANIRAQKGLDRFTLRGSEKVNIQWKLYCMVHNLEKIAGYGWN